MKLTKVGFKIGADVDVEIRKYGVAAGEIEITIGARRYVRTVSDYPSAVRHAQDIYADVTGDYPPGDVIDEIAGLAVRIAAIT